MESESSGWLIAFTNLPTLDEEGFGGTDLFVDFASVESHSVRNDHCLLTEVWDLDGSQDELVYNSTKNTSKTCLNWTASWNLRVLLFKDTEHFT